VSLNRRNQRKKQLSKSEITQKDKIFGILAIVAIVLAAIIAAIFFAFYNAH